jgi:hypothetical protein
MRRAHANCVSAQKLQTSQFANCFVAWSAKTLLEAKKLQRL